jgi:hypothetical protein
MDALFKNTGMVLCTLGESYSCDSGHIHFMGKLIFVRSNLPDSSLLPIIFMISDAAPLSFLEIS